MLIVCSVIVVHELNVSHSVVIVVAQLIIIAVVIHGIIVHLVEIATGSTLLGA